MISVPSDVKIFADKWSIDIIDYNGLKFKAHFICKKCGGEFERGLHMWKNMTPCPRCKPKGWVDPAVEISSKAREIIRQNTLSRSREIAAKIAEKLNVEVIEFYSKTHPSKIRCKKCGDIFEARTDWTLKKYTPCKKCEKTQRKEDSKIKTYNFFVGNLIKNKIAFETIDPPTLGGDAIVKIFCKIHGWFDKKIKHTAHKHICNACARDSQISSKTYDEESTIDKIAEICRERGFKFKKVGKWQGVTSTKLEICCEKHNYTWGVSPHNFLNQKWSCKKCLFENNTSTTLEFIEKSKKIHGDLYDYSKVDYKKALEKVIIICRIHGAFAQTPNNHLGGCGCPECANEIRNIKGYNGWVNYYKNHPEERASLYFIKIRVDEKFFLKIGITKNSIEHRFSYSDVVVDEIISNVEDVGLIVAKKEAYLHDILKNFRISNSNKFDGFTESYDTRYFDEIQSEFGRIASLSETELEHITKDFDFDFWKSHKI